MKRWMMLLGLSLVAALGTERAHAVAPVTPMLVTTPKLDRARLEAEIALARTRSPRTFEAVARVRAKVEALDARRRGPIPLVATLLEGLGPDAFEALAERVLVADPTLSGTALRGFRVGVIEAIGALRDPRAVEVLAPLLDDGDELVTRVAAEAIGKAGGESALLARFDRPAVIAGAGTCRRRAMAVALAGVVSRRPSHAAVLSAVRALADVGSSWAWKTGKLPHAGEERDVRAIAGAALIEAFAGFDGEIRKAASNALMVVDDEGTPARIAAAKTGASTDTVAALDQLAIRFAKNPAR